MKYYGLEIYEGTPLKELNIDENIQLADQWFNLIEDITCINYVIHEFLHFSVDVGWYPDATISPESHFRIEIIEGPYTEGWLFFEKESQTIAQMKVDLQEAVDLIQQFKKMSIEEILKSKIREMR
ncbi:MAG: hypothetical protein IT222_01540 [Crocinitomix sp.]|nr:hypothetical protein [Crocinitomix sp.]